MSTQTETRSAENRTASRYTDADLHHVQLQSGHDYDLNLQYVHFAWSAMMKCVGEVTKTGMEHVSMTRWNDPLGSEADLHEIGATRRIHLMSL